MAHRTDGAPSPISEEPSPGKSRDKGLFRKAKEKVKSGMAVVGMGGSKHGNSQDSSRTHVAPHKLAENYGRRRSSKFLALDRKLEQEEGLKEGEIKGGSRLVHMGGGGSGGAGGGVAQSFSGNAIKTAKYNVATFLPIFLFEMFSRVAYLYFLFQAGLSWWSVISPFSGVGSTLALVVVLVAAAAKAIWEDAKRHQEDKAANAAITHVVQPDGSIKDVPWRDVKVGQLIRVLDNELIPADLLCLTSGLADRVCFVKTTNLDGETNLKIRSPVSFKGEVPEDLPGWLAMEGRLECEQPNADLHHFKGRFTIGGPGNPGATTPVTINEMLLRGCMLKNSQYVLGLVVYTGPESRIQMNSTESPLKYGSFDRFLNIQISLIILLQIVMCAVCAALDTWWRSHFGYDRYWLALHIYNQGNYESGVAYYFLAILTFWILYSYLVPISLFVTMEIVKGMQGFVFINCDKMMYDKATDQYALARNTNLNEDLGKVAYVFSDKTGTLTSNEMELRQIAIKDVALGDAHLRLEDHRDTGPADSLKLFDPRLARAAAVLAGRKGEHRSVLEAGGSSAQQLQGSGPLQGNGDNEEAQLQLAFRAIDFWVNICICNSLIVEPNPDGGPPIYQGPSPDEVSLAEGARQLGFEYVSRSADTMTLRFLGEEADFKILNVLEYSSARARMSVIARCPDGTIRLFCKGADAKVLSMLRKGTDAKLLAATDANLHTFAVEGLRTLVVASKVLPQETWSAWDARYQEAASDLENRDEKVAAIAEEVEVDLEMVGITAIEDKLQDGVPDAIASLLEAGIKVWVITGDKQETAINIAISCKLITAPDSLLICNAEGFEDSKKTLQNLLTDVDARLAGQGGKAASAYIPELVIDGKTLSYILGRETEPLLAELGSRCGSVVICRASPSQKASIVRMMAEYELRKAGGRAGGIKGWWNRTMFRLEGKMLSIGDGANDVAMIQAADIGVGIMGKEGRQAVNNSDYALAQFRFLVRLLLVHGNLCHYRLARLIKYSFYKNIVFCFGLFFYQFYCGYSGQTLVDGISAALYNVIFTSVPILLFALFDRPVKNFETLVRYPQLYNRSSSLTISVFWRYSVGMAIADGAVAFFFIYYSAQAKGPNSVNDLYSLGKMLYIAMVGIVSLEVLLTARYWTWLFGIAVFLSYTITYLYAYVFPWFWKAVFSDPTPDQIGVLQQICKDPTFWLVQLAIYGACFGHRYVERAYVWKFRPHDAMILAEWEKQQRRESRGEVGGHASSHQAVVRPLPDIEAAKHVPAAQAQNGAARGGGNGGRAVEMVKPPVTVAYS